MTMIEMMTMTTDGTRAQVTEPRERRAPLRPDVRLPQEVREQNLEALSPSPREPEWSDEQDRSDDPARWFEWAGETWERDPLAAHLLCEVGRQLQAGQESSDLAPQPIEGGA